VLNERVYCLLYRLYDRKSGKYIKKYIDEYIFRDLKEKLLN